MRENVAAPGDTRASCTPNTAAPDSDHRSRSARRSCAVVDAGGHTAQTTGSAHAVHLQISALRWNRRHHPLDPRPAIKAGGGGGHGKSKRF